MIQQYLGISPDKLIKAGWETLYMVGFSLIIRFHRRIFHRHCLMADPQRRAQGKSIALHDFKRFHQHHPKHTVYHPSGMYNALYENHRRHPDRYQGGYRAISYLYQAPFLARLLETSLLEVGGGIIEAASRWEQPRSRLSFILCFRKHLLRLSWL